MVMRNLRGGAYQSTAPGMNPALTASLGGQLTNSQGGNIEVQLTGAIMIVLLIFLFWLNRSLR